MGMLRSSHRVTVRTFASRYSYLIRQGRNSAGSRSRSGRHASGRQEVLRTTEMQFRSSTALCRLSALVTPPPHSGPSQSGCLQEAPLLFARSLRAILQPCRFSWGAGGRGGGNCPSATLKRCLRARRAVGSVCCRGFSRTPSGRRICGSRWARIPDAGSCHVAVVATF